MRRYSICCGAAIFLGALWMAEITWANASISSDVQTTNHEFETEMTQPIDNAVAKLNGKTILRVRGIAGYTAEDRAQAIVKRLEAVANNPLISTETITLNVLSDRTELLSGQGLIANILDSDAAVENIPRSMLAETARLNAISAILQFRRDTSPPIILRRTIMALGATVVIAILLLVARRLFFKVRNIAERHIKSRMDKMTSLSTVGIETRPIWAIVTGSLNTLYLLLMGMMIYFYLNAVLGLYPWTRPIAEKLFSVIVDPVKILWTRFVISIPSLIFLTVLFLITRYVLKITQLVFSAIDLGTLQFEKFEKDWAWPTYRIIRVLIIALAVVVAYPYIPGSNSAAFKGVSLFMGVLFSLGSSSFIANIIAGTTMTYRRAFKVGDIIKVGEVMGLVADIRLQSTHLRTYKNEEIVIPNAQILNGNIINYTTLSAQEGLVLSASVGIGYETPWRQVEAMLLMAAERTHGLMKGKKPFVLQKSLGDFAVVYELNVYCDKPLTMLSLYTEIHKNVLDVFNEYGVQIMTPAYEGDPEKPKIVPKDQWYAEPSKNKETALKDA